MKLILLLQLLLKVSQLPDVRNVEADAFVVAAMMEETHRVPATLLVSLAWAESRFESNAQPGCGVLQVFPRDLGRPQRDCRLWRTSLVEGVRAGVVEIETLLADQRVHGDMRRALLYRACGNAFFEGTCDQAKVRWVDTAIVRWRWLSRGVGIGS